MAQTFKGACDCGQTTWEAKLEKDQQAHVLCHCNVCKKMSGGAYTLNQIIPADALKYTDDSNLKKYTYKGASGNSVDCYYCGNCTSNSHHHQQVMGPDKIVIRTALLQGTENWPVGAEIFTKDMYDWESKVASTTFPAAPE